MFKKISLGLFLIVIIAGIAGIISYKFSHKKVEGVQDINSKIINRPKDSENTTKPSNTTSNPQNSILGNQKPTITNQPSNQNSNLSGSNSNSTNSDSVSNYLIPYLSPYLPTPTHNDAYWDFLIKQAEEEAQRSHEALKNAEECFAFQTARDNALFPIKQEINNLWIEYNNVENVINEKIKGFDVSESQRIRMVEAEQHRIQLEINQLEAEYNRLYAEWGDCDY